MKIINHVLHSLLALIVWAAIIFVGTMALSHPHLREVLAFGDKVTKQQLEYQVNTVYSLGMDWFPPQVKINAANRKAEFTFLEYTMTSNELIDSWDLPQDWDLQLISTPKSGSDLYYYIITARNVDKDGQNQILKFRDSAANIALSEVNIEPTTKQVTPIGWPSGKFTDLSMDILMIVNKEYKLPQDYQPKDLVSLGSLGVVFTNQAKVRKEVGTQLQKMTKEIVKAGISYNVSSGFRSFSTQVGTYGYWLEYYKGDRKGADSISARPGHSEHQLGTTVDFTTSENGWIFDNFANTRLAKWLAGNAWKYGFAISYPPGKQDITGYMYEPWHYRYIGVDNAKQFRESGLTLVEWLKLQSNSNAKSEIEQDK